jgi:glucose-6-phosphate isomerase
MEPRSQAQDRPANELARGNALVREDAARALHTLAERDIAQRIWNRDHTVWRSDPTEIRDRLGWLDLPRTMPARVAEIQRIAEEVRAQADDVVLLGMGGSSLAPEVFAQSFGVRSGFPRLHVLDSTSPNRIRAVAESVNWKRVHVLTSSKSGSTIEVRTLFAYFFERLREAGLSEPGRCFTAITDPGTSLAELAAAKKFARVLLNPPDLGGRYSALSLFGLVPAAFLGIDIAQLLERAQSMAARCEAHVPVEENPGMRLGALLGSAALAGRDKLTLRIAVPIDSFALWIEQLVAESTGKDGRGIVPVVGEPPVDPSSYANDRLFIGIPCADSGPPRNAAALEAAGHPVAILPAADAYDLGAQIFLWEFATAVAGHLLGIQPFDQPNVEAAKKYARDLIDALKRGRPLEKIPEDDPVPFLESASPADHVGIMVYGDPDDELIDALQSLRAAIVERTRAATTLGVGPRFLHSTGQLHKGGSDHARYLQILLRENPLPIPGEPFGFDQLLSSQASGDYRALMDTGKSVLRTPATREPHAEVRNWIARLRGAKG